MRVEALGHVLRRDPVREMRHLIAGQPQFFRAQHLEQGDLALLQSRTIVFEPFQAFGRDQRLLPRLAREQNARFLERFADGRGDQPLHLPGQSRRAIDEVTQRVIEIPGRNLAAGKDKRARDEIDLVMALHHKHFEPIGGVACDQDGRRRDDRGRFF